MPELSHERRRVSATDLDNPDDWMTREVGDDYLPVGVGRCSTYDVVVHYRKDGTQTYVFKPTTAPGRRVMSEIHDGYDVRVRGSRCT